MGGIYFAFTLTLLFTLTAGAALPRSSLPSHRLGNVQGDEKQTNDMTTPRDATAPHEAIASCRATCIEQILQWPPTNDGCLGTKDCLDCWEMCSKLYQDEYTWRSMCTDDDQCMEGFGCSLACKFDFASVSMPVVMPMLFKTTPITTAPSDQKLVVAWDAPVPVVNTGHYASHPYFIYTLLFRDEANPHWIRVITTMELSATVDGPHTTFRGLEFLLIASAARGTVAQEYPPYPAALDLAPVAGPSEPERPVEQHVEEVPVAPFDQFPAKMSSVTVRTLTGPGGSLEAEMTWKQNIPAASVQFVYSIHWSLVSCNVDSNMPPCHLGHEEKYTIQVKAIQKEDMRIVLTGLVYNAQYKVDVGFQGADTSESSVFFTPACPNVDATYRTCIPSTDPPKETERVTESTSTTSTSTTQPTTSTTTTPKPSTTTAIEIAASTTAPSLVTEDRLRNFLPLLLQAREKHDVKGGLSVDVIFLSTGVTFGSFFMIVAIYMVYTRFCKKPDPTAELAKALQSYSQLPLIDPSTPSSLSSSMHRLHHAINMGMTSPATPTSYLATPPGYHKQMAVSSPNIMSLQQNLLLRAAANAAAEAQLATPSWHSMNILQDTPPNLVQTAANVQQSFIRSRPADVVPQETMVGIDSYGTPQVTMATPSSCKMPRKVTTPTSRSMEHLNIQVADMSRRAASFSDISQPTARRQINFSSPSVTAQPPSSASPVRHQTVCPTILVSPPTVHEEGSCVSQVELVPQQDRRYLRTVYEEGWVDQEDDSEDYLDDPNEEGQFGEVLEWDYNSTLPFRNRVETM